jgi:hypothetical protein
MPCTNTPGRKDFHQKTTQPTPVAERGRTVVDDCLSNETDATDDVAYTRPCACAWCADRCVGTAVALLLSIVIHPGGKTMSTRFVRVSRAIAAAVGAICACATASAASSIEPPQAEQVMSTTASGVQNYSCEYDAQHHLGWVFTSPQATLYDAGGHAIIHHAAGPSWEAEDGSRIVGHVVAQTPSDTAASIPQLLLETRSTAASGELSGIRYVQRVKTVGGMMPVAPCSAEHEIGSSPYLANYVFYK